MNELQAAVSVYKFRAGESRRVSHRRIKGIFRSELGQILQFLQINGPQISLSKITFDAAKKAVSHQQLRGECYMALPRRRAGVDDRGCDDATFVQDGFDQH